jgi:hypothetical protein
MAVRPISLCTAGSVVAYVVVLQYGREGCHNMPFFKRGKSSKRKEFENNLQEGVEYLEKTVQDVEERLQAISHG